MSTAKFTETQRFNQWWALALISLPALMFLVIGLLPVNDKQGNPVHFSDVLIPFLASLLFISWFLFIQLTTVADEKGISVRFRGIPFGKRFISWNEIQAAQIVAYSPLSDYGGWGLRYGLSSGWCYTVKGKTGLKLLLKNGKQLMIGTHQKEALQDLLNLYLRP